jgi:DNA-binding transcriptional MerR regulator
MGNVLLDKEWYELILEARNSGVSIEEIKGFLSKESMITNENHKKK